MTVLEVQTGHRVLDEYNKNIGKSLRPDRLSLPIRAGVFDVEEADMWIEAGMSFTRKRLIDACVFLTTFDLLTDEGVDYSKYGEVHIYKITRTGIIVANNPGGLEDLMLDNGNVIFTKLTQLVNHKQSSNSISNTFVNSPVNQLQQAQDTSNTNVSQANTVDNSTTTKNKTTLNFEPPKKRKTFKNILIQWWWAFIIPIAIGVIILAIEYHWFSKS
ncbi:MAG: hypothetical protein JWQ09_4601 [Segetibacter sp.]|nr:hypothetical protein [Segetibacter sp.]